VNHSTWSTLENLWAYLKSVSVLSTLITDVELYRGDSMKGGELRTCLGLEDCVEMKIVA
jgi:hypothetical protein